MADTSFPSGTRPRPMARWYSIGNARRFLWNYLRGLREGHPDLRPDLAAVDTPADPGWEPWVDLAPAQEGTGESWVDFMSDVGDGYDAVHTVAYVSEAPELAQLQGADRSLPRAEAVLFGGDSAYPIATGAVVRDRLLRPHHDAREAWRQLARPWLGIPGNHDWYNDLRGFREVFVDSELDGDAGDPHRHFDTPQRRSYFAARLAHNWWVLAIDTERTGDLDADQVTYFETALRYAGAYPQPRVIVITHDPLPHPDRPAGTKSAPPRLQGLLDWLALQRADVKLWLSGDLHFYRHDPAHGRAPDRIICGGGGAFLHPTHAEDPTPAGVPEPRLFPEPAESRGFAWRGLLFPFLNPSACLMVAALYALTFVAASHVPWLGAGVFFAVVAVGLLLSSVLFAAREGAVFASTAGMGHGLAHAALYLFGATRLQSEPHGWALLAALGGVAATTLFGVYLWSCLCLFRKHRNGAFSALRIPHYKSFVRMHVDPKGELRVYPIGIRQVTGQCRAHEGQRARDAHAQRLTPSDPAGPSFELIGGAPIDIGR